MDVDGFEAAEVEQVEIPRPEKRQRKSNQPPTIFKKDVWAAPALDRLRGHATAVRKHAFMSTAYFVPTALLVELGVRTALCDALTARPKSKKFQGKETRPFWPLWHERGDWIAIPRQFGVKVFGPPASVTINPGRTVRLEPQRPLFDATTCVAAKGIDQKTAVGHVVDLLQGSAERDGFGSCMFCISPGFGKTCCSAHVIAALGVKTLFVVPNENPFMKQVADEMRRFLGPAVRVGKMVTSEKRKWDVGDDADPDTRKDIVITTAKSVATIGAYDLSSFGLVIVDEAHETATAMYSQMYYRFGARYVLLLTATPERAADHCGGYLQWLGGPVAWHEQRDLTRLRWGGVNVTVYNLTYERPIKEVLLKSGEPYWEGMTRQIVSRRDRDRFLLETVIAPRHRAGRRILIIGTRVEHMEAIHEALNGKWGIPAGIIVGKHSDGRKVTPEDRDAAQRQPVIVASVSIVSKALNIPELDTLLVLSGGCYVNATFWTQCVGRITRDHKTKQDPELILIRDRYPCADARSDGVFAGCVDAACRTLRRRSREGFRFATVEATIH